MAIDPEIASSLLTFGEDTLGFRLYGWQDEAIEPFDHLGDPGRIVMVSLATPNESGKSSVVIPTIVLGLLSVYRRCKIVLISADGKQVDGQVMPALERHRGKFPHWKFIEREILTPGPDGTFSTGSRFIAFTTDDPGRAEGWQPDGPPDMPLVMIVDEAKTVPDKIFEALDRCGYHGLLYTSSPGPMRGRFYESQFGRQDFVKVRVGLKDCPHIKPEKIARLQEQYGPNGTTPNPTLIASILDGQFMEADTELRFNPAGLKLLTDMAETHDRIWRAEARTMPGKSCIGELVDQAKGPQWLPDQQTGWVWIIEHPQPGLEYIGFADPMTGEQSEGAKERDTHAMGVMRKGYQESNGTLHDDEVVAVLHHPNGVRWDNDIATERLSLLLRYYGDCIVIVEANNAGVEVMRLLKMMGRNLWLREKRDHNSRDGKKLRVMGFQTNSATKGLWIGALGRAIREESLVCKYPMACSHFSTFILTEDGSGEAQPNCHDDFVTGVGLSLFAREAATKYPLPRVMVPFPRKATGAWS